MKEVLQHISNWERVKNYKNNTHQMEEAFWNLLKNIETETYDLCQLHIKELVEDCATYLTIMYLY